MPNINRTALNQTLLALAIISLLSGCAGSGTVASNGSRVTNLASENNSSPILVSVAAVQPSTSEGDLIVPASISVENTAVVLSQRDGTIIQLRGQEGGRVAKGAILAQLNDEEQRSQFRQGELEIARLKVEEQQYESLVKLNRSELEREKLLARDGVSSPRDVERAQYKFDQGMHEFEKTRLATQSARARLDALRIEIEKSSVRAPVGGVIMRRYVNLGTGVAKNEKLFEISQLSPLEVKFQLPQTEKVRLAPGQFISVSPIDSEQIIARARVRRRDPMADATNNTIGYVAQLVGGRGLMPGLAINVRVPRSSIGSAVYVPRTAFPVGANLHQGAVSSLLVVEGDICADRIVAVSEVDGERVEVISGLNAGDEVIVAPPAHLKAGDRIEISGRL